MLAKSFDHHWHNVKIPSVKGQEIYDFIEAHQCCCDELEEDTCGCHPFDPDFEPFELTYENRPDWGNKQTLQERDRELHPEKYK